MTADDADIAARDDRVLPLTRGVAYAIVPFLVVAFAVLYPWPDDTGRLFAWRIRPTMTAMVLGSAYLGGAYFFIRAARATAWHTIKGGFVAVGVFASLMGVATILHWGTFNHDHVAFWLWVLLYFTTPFLIFWVWLRNRGYDAPAAADDVLLPPLTARLIGVVGVLALVTGLFLVLLPGTAARWWPWHLTPLTSRVLGAICCLGLAGVGAPVDRRWSSARLPLQVAVVMLILILVAGARAHAEFDPANILTWLLAAGFTGVTVSIAIVYRRMRRLAGPR
ncbi:MAG: hypothetical protein QOI74_943 [Micromonosporaceae bacterium]|nr:hypothetical protein [Micromonosporaceae bacterium]MDT5034960.1 hypothetical protein [Micromonosporaceae bacterium]